jgi:hypothetical protein
MSRKRTITAHFFQCDNPDWRPLQLAVGEDLMWPWMWMGEVRTRQGVAYHAYKHRWTRRYVHLGVDGEAIQYVGRHRYERVELVDALEDALCSWWEELDATPEDTAACWIAIERARRLAERPAT